MATGWQHEEVEFVEDECHVHGVTSHALNARHELNGRLKLGRQQQHLKVEERLLVGVEVALS